MDRLYTTNVIDEETHSILARFQAQLYKAGMIFTARSSFEPRSTSGNPQALGDIAAKRIMKINSSIQSLIDSLGRQNVNMLLACLTQDWRLSKDAAGILKRAGECLNIGTD